VTRPSTTLRYGVSRKPYSFRRAYSDSELIRPMFGPRASRSGTPAVVGRVHVAHLEAGALARQAARPSAETRRLCVISDSGLVWS